MVAAVDSAGRGVHGSGIDVSTLTAATRSLDLSLRWLAVQQHQDGSWAQSMYPAITAMAVMVYCLDPRRAPGESMSLTAQKGIDFLLKCVQPDGGIYVPSEQAPSLPCYNTALCLTALSLTGDPRYRSVIEKARAQLIAGQHLGSDVFNGGFGYEKENGRETPGDLSDTYMALEALSASEAVLSDNPQALRQKKLNRDAALQFLSRVQNLPASNDQPWARHPSAADLGGFVYSPVESKVGEAKDGDASGQFHSYGSMSYAGLLSLIYAQVDRNDPRVQGAVGWIRRHYTVEENPGMGLQGLYYSYHTMAQALSQWGENPLLLENGQAAWWRRDLVRKLISLQRVEPKSSTGFWVNSNGRWWENDPVLATCFATMTMEVALQPARRP